MEDKFEHLFKSKTQMTISSTAATENALPTTQLSQIKKSANLFHFPSLKNVEDAVDFWTFCSD